MPGTSEEHPEPLPFVVEGEEAVGAVVSEKLQHLSNHYAVPKRQLELILLAAMVQEIGSLTPTGEERSDSNTFAQRFADRQQMVLQAVNDATQAVLLITEKRAEMDALCQRLKGLIGKLDEPSGDL